MSIYKEDIVNHIVNHFTNICSTSIPLSHDMDLVDVMIHSLIDDNKTNMFSMIPSTLYIKAFFLDSTKIVHRVRWFLSLLFSKLIGYYPLGC